MLPPTTSNSPLILKGGFIPVSKTYSELPKDANGKLVFSKIQNYTDTADTGDDYLCSINYGVYNGEAYVLDVLLYQGRHGDHRTGYGQNAFMMVR